MRDADVGRVLVASLHQGISDVLPTRLEFYEGWLNAEGLRDGTIGLAPLGAVLSFLRQEGEAYETIMTRAGEYAAEWTVASMRTFEHGLIQALPLWLRSRIVLRLARGLVRSSYQGSRAVAKVRRRSAQVDVKDSVFCSVPDPVARPLCGFYAAACAKLLALFNMPATARIVACRGTGEPQCAVAVALFDRRAVPETDAA